MSQEPIVTSADADESANPIDPVDVENAALDEAAEEADESANPIDPVDVENAALDEAAEEEALGVQPA